MSERDQISVSLKLTPVGQSDQPISVNATTLNLAQGVAYIDFGFVDPNEIVAVVRDAKAGKTTPKTMEGRLIVRVSMPLETFHSFRNQIDQVLREIGGVKEKEEVGQE